MKKTHAWLLGGIVVVGAVLRALYLIELQDKPDYRHPLRDAAYHHYWAAALAEGSWDALEGHTDPMIARTPFFRPPGYPYFLGLIYRLFGDGPLAPRIAQMMLGLLNCLLAFWLGRKWFGASVGLLFAAFMAVSWVFIYFEGELLAPALVITLALGLLYALGFLLDRMSPIPALVSGILLGAGALVHPNVLAFAPFAAIWIAWLAYRQKKLRLSLSAVPVFLLGVLLAVAPATVRNYCTARDFVLICANGGVNLYLGNNAQCNGVDPAGPAMWSWNSFDYPLIVRNLEIRLGKPLKYGESSSYFAGLAFRYVTEHPWDAARLTLKKACLFWGPREIGNEKEDALEKANSRVLRSLPFSFPAVLALALTGMGIAGYEIRRRSAEKNLTEFNRKQIAFGILVVAFIGVYFATYVPFFAAGRFRVPIIPFLLLLGAIGLGRIGGYLRDRRWRPAGAWLLALILLYGLAGINVCRFPERPERWHIDRGTAYARGHEWDKAIAELKKALDIVPNEPEAHLQLGICLRDTGRLEEALEHFSKAAAIYRDSDKAYFAKGLALGRFGRRDEALQAFSEVLRINPSHGGAHARMGVLLALQGKTDDAVFHFSEVVRTNPDYLQARVGLGFALLDKKRYEEASVQFREALRIKPDDPYAQQGMQRALEGKRKASEPP